MDRRQQIESSLAPIPGNRFRRWIAPTWLMGLSNATLGFGTGITLFVVPGLLAARHTPEPKIAAVTAVAMSANFWAIIFAPFLDVGFSRRFYATALAAITAALTVLALLNVDHLPFVAAALALGMATAWLANNALGGWLSTVCPEQEKYGLSAWFNIALISGTGFMSAVGGELVHNLSLQSAAWIVGGIVLLPTLIFLFIPMPDSGEQRVFESSARFMKELFEICRNRRVLLVLVCFLSPTGSFGIANLTGGLGGDFHASARTVSLVGGAGAMIAGLAGCLLVPPLAKRVPLVPFYLLNAIAGSLFTAVLIVLPRASWAFCLALLGLFLFQAASYAIQVAIVFDVVGPANRLAATTFSIMTAATNIPVTYMMFIDGKGYLLRGVAGMLVIDAAMSLASAFLLIAAFMSLGSDVFTSKAIEPRPLDALIQVNEEI